MFFFTSVRVCVCGTEEEKMNIEKKNSKNSKNSMLHISQDKRNCIVRLGGDRWLVFRGHAMAD